MQSALIFCAVIPFPYGHPTSAANHTQSSSQTPPCRFAVEEKELQNECQDHIHRPHQCNRSSFLNLQGFGEERLTGNTEQPDGHEHPPVPAAVRNGPFVQDEQNNDTLDESHNCIVPHREVVMNTFPYFSQNDHSASRSDRPCEGSHRAFDVIGVVSFDPRQLSTKDEGRSGYQYDAGERKHGKNDVPYSAPLLEENPSQQGCEDWITEHYNCGIR